MRLPSSYFRRQRAWPFVLALICVIAVACSDEPGSPPTAVAPKSVPATATPAATATVAATPLPTAQSDAGAAPTAAAATPSPTPAATPTAPQPTVAPSPSPRPIPEPSGGVLNLAARHAAPHLDVHQEVSPALSTWGPGIVYSRLLRLQSGPDVELPTLAVECELCESWHMEDPTTLVFTMRRDVRWQDAEPVDGRPLTADDLAFSYDRQRQPGWPNAGLLAMVDGVEATGVDTLRLSLLAPDADILVALADGHSKIVSREAVELGGDLKAGPAVGSGPWSLAKSGLAEGYVFERNQMYFEEGLPLLDSIRIHVLEDEATRSAAFGVGRIDLHQVEPAEWPAMRERLPNAPLLRSMDAGAGLEVALNTRAAPFDDPSARAAAFLAMDPWRAVEEVWLGAAFVGLGMPPARADWLLEDAMLRPYFADPEAARDRFGRLPEGPPRTARITVGDFGESYDSHARLIAEELEAVGFEVSIGKVNRRVFAERVWIGGEYQMFVGPIAPMVTPNAYLLTLLHSQGRWNTTGHRDDTLDALIEAQAQTFDEAERRELVREIQARALQGAYRHMPAASVSLWSWWPRVRGFHPNFAASEYAHWRLVWLQG